MTKKFKFDDPDTNYVVSALSDYVGENHDLLVKQIVLPMENSTIGRISIQTGVKGSAPIHILDIDVELQDGSACGFTAQDEGFELTDRVISTAQIKINADICDKKLIGKWAEYLVRIGATDKELPFEEWVFQGVVADIAKKVEALIWKGVKTGGSDLLDGFLKVLAVASAPTESISSGATAYEGILQVYNAMTDETIDKGGAIFVAPAIFRAFMQDLVALNLYHFNPGDENLTEFPLPGTDVRVIKTPGLASSLKIVGTFPQNLYYGTDLMSNAEDVDIWYSKDARVFKLAVEFNAGVQVAFPDQAVVGTFAATPVKTTGVNAGVASIAANTAELADGDHVFKTEAAGA